ncbi:hypothetical protein HanIR_Chr05g0217761 [Helianthus annuus]|nr:hypothetical protein HanIR_Chr05g0217761 [Helianthus annuus]
MEEASGLFSLSVESLLNKGDRKIVKQKKKKKTHCNIMALEFNRVALEMAGVRSLIREKS